MKYPVEFIATSWNEFEEKKEIEHGVLFAKTYADAMKEIEKYYGDSLIDIKISLCEESRVYILEYTQNKHMHNMLKISGSISEWENEE